jgi:hypothetical protein
MKNVWRAGIFQRAHKEGEVLDVLADGSAKAELRQFRC